MKENLLLLGIIFIIIGFVLLFIYFIYEIFKATKEKKTEVKGGGVVLIGPIPIIFGSSERAVKIAVIGAIILMALAIGLIVFSYILSRSIVSKIP